RRGQTEGAKRERSMVQNKLPCVNERPDGVGECLQSPALFVGDGRSRRLPLLGRVALRLHRFGCRRLRRKRRSVVEEQLFLRFGRKPRQRRQKQLFEGPLIARVSLEQLLQSAAGRL